jgi:hypothetical protein
MDEIITAIVLPVLKEIVKHPEKGLENVRQFQSLMASIEEHPSEDSEALWETLRDLSYDLAYYEPDEIVRRGDSSLFGEDRMKEQVLSAINMIQKRTPTGSTE